MRDPTTLSYINMFAVLPALSDMLRLDAQARDILSHAKPTRLGISVASGPSATFAFANGACQVEQGTNDVQIRLPFRTCEKFNGMIAGTVTPLPSKGFTHLSFLLKTFTKLTDRMSLYLKGGDKAPTDEAFMQTGTEMLLFVVARAVAQIANHDPVGRVSASYIADGDICLCVAGGPRATIRCKDHVLSCVPEDATPPRAIMEFQDMALARRLFDGKVNAVACIGNGTIRMSGLISMLDNCNRLLDRVSEYLA